MTHDAHDAEDATQAAFLTLAVHAKTSGKIRYLGPWLKKVSHRLALDIRRSKKRRVAREHRHAEDTGHSNGNGHGAAVSSDLQIEELRGVLREEIDKLPAKYRMPLILHYFGGMSPEEMSRELGCNTSTLGVRLHRGRKMLAGDLTSRGISINAAIVAGVLSGLVDSFVRDNLSPDLLVRGGPCRGAGSCRRSRRRRSGDGADAGDLRHVTLDPAESRRRHGFAAVGTFAGGSEALLRYDVLNASILGWLNPLRLIRPVLDRVFQVPNLRVRATPFPTPLPESQASDAILLTLTPGFMLDQPSDDLERASPGPRRWSNPSSSWRRCLWMTSACT